MANTNLESALANGISKGIREGVGGAIADGLVGLATIATLAAILLNFSPSQKPDSTEADPDWNRGLKRGDQVAGYTVGSDVGYRIHPLIRNPVCKGLQQIINRSTNDNWSKL